MRCGTPFQIAAICLVVASSPSALEAEVKLPAVIGDQMVLQRGRPVPIWGWADVGETVSVSIAGESVEANAGADGRWRVTLPALEAGAAVRVFDPEALANVRRLFGDALTYCDRAYGTTEGADALAIVTEWQEFRNPDFEVLRRLMNRPVVVDGRNLYDPAQMARLGFTYASVGRQTVTPVSS